MVNPGSGELRQHATLLTRLLDALPASARAAYGAELAAVYEDILRETFAEAGIAGVRRRMPGLVADVGAAIVLEYIDAWRRGFFPPLQVAVWSLFGAAFVWSLTLVAAFGEARWLTTILEFNLGLTVSFMLGLPIVSLAASRVGTGPGRPSEGRAVFCASIAVTAVAWTVFLCHAA